MKPKPNPHRPLALFLLAILLLGLVAVAVAPDSDAEPADYYVNRNRGDDGDHEVHRDGCKHPPDAKNREPLGRFADCAAAVRAAKKRYPTADGCYHCSRPCHTS